MGKTKSKTPPTLSELERERNRERYKKNDYTTLRSTVYPLVTVAVLVAVLLLPVLQIYGSSTVGCVAQEPVVGKIVFRVWP